MKTWKYSLLAVGLITVIAGSAALADETSIYRIPNAPAGLSEYNIPAVEIHPDASGVSTFTVSLPDDLGGTSVAPVLYRQSNDSGEYGYSAAGGGRANCKDGLLHTECKIWWPAADLQKNLPITLQFLSQKYGSDLGVLNAKSGIATRFSGDPAGVLIMKRFGP